MHTKTLIALNFSKILQSRTYTVIILAAENKRFAIYTEVFVGKLLQSHLTDGEKIRPMTHDLIQLILRGLNAKILKIVITDVQDNVYFAKLYLIKDETDATTIIDIDSRPSDAITLAILSQAPLYCTSEVLEKVINVEE
jgi:bifunctional DNase/RNase